jgi:hypothetical protein
MCTATPAVICAPQSKSGAAMVVILYYTIIIIINTRKKPKFRGAVREPRAQCIIDVNEP